jgi:DNA-binding NarL/FixJ family response regulator
MMQEIWLVIVDDHPIVRRGLREVIEHELDLKVLAEAGDGEIGLELIRKLLPQIAVLDLDMPKLDGFAVARRIRQLNLPVETIFLTVHNELDLLDRAMDVGGKAFIAKESALLDIVNGIRSVAEGRLFVSPSMTGALLDRRATAMGVKKNMPGLASLTPAERRILSMIAAGKSTKEIAAELYIHSRTVETHRASICSKLQLSGTNSLLRYALEHKSELAL